jgi:hypothetical protein
MAIPHIRPQYLWGAHFFIFFVYLGFLASNILPFSIDIAKPFAVVWFGVIMLHTMAAFGAFDGDEPRKHDEEKPKHRVELSDDGELVEVDDSADDEEKRKRLMGD